jgi:hypothetical protein
MTKSSRKKETSATGAQGDLIISGSVGALRDLADPPPLSDEQLKIVHWYEQLVNRLSGPRTGDDRGKAKQPSWVRQGPRIDGVTIVSGEDSDRLGYLVEGSGFTETTEVLVGGATVSGWQVLAPSRLLIPIEGDPPEQTEIEIRTPDGDVAMRVGITAGLGVE